MFRAFADPTGFTASTVRNTRSYGSAFSTLSGVKSFGLARLRSWLESRSIVRRASSCDSF